MRKNANMPRYDRIAENEQISIDNLQMLEYTNGSKINISLDSQEGSER